MYSNSSNSSRSNNSSSSSSRYTQNIHMHIYTHKYTHSSIYTTINFSVHPSIFAVIFYPIITCTPSSKHTQINRYTYIHTYICTYLGLSYFSFQPVLHEWCNKGRGMYYPVCGMMHIKWPLLLIGKSSICGGSGFTLSLSEWSFTICPTPYNRK